MTLHNYRSGQVHETLNGINPSCSFRDMRSAKSGPNLWQIDKFLAHGQAHMGQMGIWPWQCTPTGLDNSTELRMEKIHQAVTEIWVPQVWQPPARPPTHPPARTVTTIPLQPGGLRGNNWGLWSSLSFNATRAHSHPPASSEACWLPLAACGDLDKPDLAGHVEAGWGTGVHKAMWAGVPPLCCGPGKGKCGKNR